MIFADLCYVKCGGYLQWLPVLTAVCEITMYCHCDIQPWAMAALPYCST